MNKIINSMLLGAVLFSAACSPSSSSSSDAQTREQETSHIDLSSTSKEQSSYHETCVPTADGQYENDLCAEIAEDFLAQLSDSRSFDIACSKNDLTSGIPYWSVKVSIDGITRVYPGLTKGLAGKLASEVLSTYPDCQVEVFRGV